MPDTEKNKESLLPNFELAELLTFPLDVFLQSENQELANLILAFTVIYNDFKDYWWFKRLFDDVVEKIDTTKKTGLLGQLNGLSEHCVRMLIAQFLELLNTIKEHKKLYDCTEFKTMLHYLRHIRKDLPGDWWMLVRLSESKSSENKFHNTLIRIRNNGTYHYKDTKCLNQGLKYYIDKKDAVGYVSLGNTLEKTRFYYGDAIIQYYHKMTIDEFGPEFDVTFREYMDKVNILLRFLVEIYLRKIVKVI